MARPIPALTRRAAVTQMLAAAAALAGTRVNFTVPPGACDCHTHIFGDPAKFPFFKGRVYTPPPALPSEMAALHRALHMERVVIVTPSVYGVDNAATLYGMKAREQPPAASPSSTTAPRTRSSTKCPTPVSVESA